MAPDQRSLHAAHAAGVYRALSEARETKNCAACECGDSCAHGYFCHSPCDTCVDDSDCGGKGTYNYDLLDHRWECEFCWPFP
jgi:hypothetical protein